MKKLLFLLLFVFSICQSLCAQQIIDVPVFDGDEQTPFPHPRSTSINPLQCYFNPEVSEVKLVFQADQDMKELHITPEEQEFGNQYVVRLNELAKR